MASAVFALPYRSRTPGSLPQNTPQLTYHILGFVGNTGDGSMVCVCRTFIDMRSDMKDDIKQFIFCTLLLVLGQLVQAAEYSLDIRRETVNITGHPVEKITVNGSLPGPVLQWTEGEEVNIHVTNHMNEPSSVHWHGILLEGAMDGVKDFNGYPGIAPGETFTYRFTLRQHGTYWYHAHTQGQEQDGLYGALIVHPQHKKADADREHVVVISDFSEEDASAIQANLKKSSDYYNHARRTVGNFFDDVKAKGFKRAWLNAADWGAMRMSPTDLADVSGYTFLINGLTPEQNWIGIFKPGERVKLRLINASAMSFYDVRILDSGHKYLKMTVVATDGRAVEPVTVDELRFGVAETYDVIVTPKEDKAYTFVAEPVDRSGFAIGTLLSENMAPREGMTGIVPAQRSRALLTMADMGANHDMGEMDHSTMTDEEMQDMLIQMKSGWKQAGTPKGAKALSYADLRSENTQKDTRDPQRTIEVRLGGNMERYLWTINGKKFEEAEPIALTLGERVRLTFINDSMMAHPMHLHGMFVQLDNGQPAAKLPDKTVVIVAPGDSYSVLLTADEPGEWAFHCHLLNHMMSGMMTKVVVATLPGTGKKDHDHGSSLYHAFTLQADHGAGNDEHNERWDLDGWIGGDIHKLWIKSEGETEDHQTHRSENWLLYSRNVDTFWDLQTGLRYDDQPESVAYGVIGFNGLAPYGFETEAHLFISDEGDVSARLHIENNLLLTQQWVLKPYAEWNLFTQEVDELGADKGVSDTELGLQLRYEVTRKFAPYMDLRHERDLGDDKDSDTIISAGLRLMF